MASGATVNEIGYPAYAGIDPLDKSLALRNSWLPRIRGDRPIEKDVLPRPENGYPAYAGIDLCSVCSKYLLRRLPRIRGDRP